MPCIFGTGFTATHFRPDDGDRGRGGQDLHAQNWKKGAGGLSRPDRRRSSRISSCCTAPTPTSARVRSSICSSSQQRYVVQMLEAGTRQGWSYAEVREDARKKCRRDAPAAAATAPRAAADAIYDGRRPQHQQLGQADGRVQAARCEAGADRLSCDERAGNLIARVTHRQRGVQNARAQSNSLAKPSCTVKPETIQHFTTAAPKLGKRPG